MAVTAPETFSSLQPHTTQCLTERFPDTVAAVLDCASGGVLSVPTLMILTFAPAAWVSETALLVSLPRVTTLTSTLPSCLALARARAAASMKYCWSPCFCRYAIDIFPDTFVPAFVEVLSLPDEQAVRLRAIA